jgi:hypothetical protein
MNRLTNVDVFAPPQRARNTKEWFERAKLVVAMARDPTLSLGERRL